LHSLISVCTSIFCSLHFFNICLVLII
jgi:hypothetical protein